MKRSRLYIVFAFVTAFHILAIVGLYFFSNYKPAPPKDAEHYIELTDFQYSGPPPESVEPSAPVPAQAAAPVSAPQNEIVDASLPPDPDAPPANSVPTESSSTMGAVAGTGGPGSGDGDGDNPDYVPMQSISQLPVIPEKFLRSKLEYPEMARRSGIMGRVFLELFIDSKGRIRKVEVLKEDPAGYGFATAAVSALDGCTCMPAKMNGEAVAVRYRYPIRFSIN